MKLVKPQSAYRDGFGILNPQGNLWSPEVFETKEQAKDYFARFWSGVKSAPDWSQYSLTWCRQRTICIIGRERTALSQNRGTE